MPRRAPAQILGVVALMVVAWILLAAATDRPSVADRGSQRTTTGLAIGDLLGSTPTPDRATAPNGTPGLTATDPPSVTPLPAISPTGELIAPSTAARTSAPTATPAPAPTPKPTPTRTPPPTDAPTTAPSDGWVTVVDDTFANGGVPRHWSLYDAPYGSGPKACAAPSHVFVSGGVLHLRLSYEPTGAGSAGCGPGWYSGGMSLHGFSTVDQQVTVRFRVVRDGVAGHFIVPMRWPDDDSAWPAAGEEDYCETSDLGSCGTFLHYDASNRQIDASYGVDLSRWHTIRTERRDHVVRIFIDDMTTPRWTYRGTADTLPDTLKHVVLQQECQSSCPSGTSGSEEIEVDRITVADPR